jgi:hypothetical protein
MLALFIGSGFVAGRVAYVPMRRLSKALRLEELNRAVAGRVRTLLGSVSSDDFFKCYCETLAWLLRWLAVRITVLACQVAIVLVCFVSVDWLLHSLSPAATQAATLCEWTFSVSALIGGLIKSGWN